MGWQLITHTALTVSGYCSNHFATVTTKKKKKDFTQQKCNELNWSANSEVVAWFFFNVVNVEPEIALQVPPLLINGVPVFSFSLGFKSQGPSFAGETVSIWRKA